MFKVVVLKSAQKDILNATYYYNSKQKGLGLKFLDEIRTTIQFIELYPKANSIKYNSVRTTTLSKFPFLIHFSINEPNKIVKIEAVYHTSLNPENWSSK